MEEMNELNEANVPNYLDIIHDLNVEMRDNCGDPDEMNVYEYMIAFVWYGFDVWYLDVRGTRIASWEHWDRENVTFESYVRESFNEYQRVINSFELEIK